MHFHFKSENQLEFGYSGLGFESVEIQSLGNAAYVHVACQKVLGSNSSWNFSHFSLSQQNTIIQISHVFQLKFDVPCELPEPTTNLSQLSFLLIFSLLYSISEWREGFWKLTRGRWEVTRVVTKEELGKPVERLREQMEKLQLHSAKMVMLEQQLAMAEERVRRLEAEKQARAEQAERSISMHLLVAFFFFTLTF